MMPKTTLALLYRDDADVDVERTIDWEELDIASQGPNSVIIYNNYLPIGNVTLLTCNFISNISNLHLGWPYM